jgi:hypothetical protein
MTYWRNIIVARRVFKKLMGGPLLLACAGGEYAKAEEPARTGQGFRSAGVPEFLRVPWFWFRGSRFRGSRFRGSRFRGSRFNVSRFFRTRLGDCAPRNPRVVGGR